MRLEREKIIAACQTSLLPCIHITPTPGAAPGPLDSKFGGEFYLPAGAEAPEMEFLAQVNFAQVPYLEGFPEKGLLQFFLCTDEETFESFAGNDSSWKQDAGLFKVLYYPEIPEDAPACENRVPEKRRYMKSLVGGMEFLPAEEIATISVADDGGFAIDLGYESLEDVLMPIFQAAWEEDADEDDSADADELEEEEGVYDLENSCQDTDQFTCDFGNWGFKLGGHPALRQGEFRLDGEGLTDYAALLFQYDLTPPDDASKLEEDTFCFFIKPADLKACRFDDILMVHHNCY